MVCTTFSSARPESPTTSIAAREAAFRLCSHQFAVAFGAKPCLPSCVNPNASWLCRDPAAVQPWTETCGQIRPLIEEKDGAAAEVHHLEITDAKLHYHQRTDEIYYVIDGQGHMRLDDDEIELKPGVVVYVPRGVKHKAWGQLKVLVTCIPRGVLADVHELE